MLFYELTEYGCRLYTRDRRVNPREKLVENHPVAKRISGLVQDQMSANTLKMGKITGIGAAFTIVMNIFVFTQSCSFLEALKGDGKTGIFTVSR